jgi:D-alanyl-D-alanine carboxypeptidase/D-alanyl-D-alanine-endopeptidase (penicillin-binding protein 4)
VSDATGRLDRGGIADDPSTPPASAPSPLPPAAGPVLAAAPPAASATGAATGPATAPGVARVIAPLLRDRALGPGVGAAVLDVSDGTVLYSAGAQVPRTPASVVKLLTGAAALAALGPQHRLETRAVAGATSGEVVLVGGGDPTLTAGSRRGYPAYAALPTLARATAAALKERGTTSVRIGVDDALFAAPAVSTAWSRTYVSSGVVAPVSALAVDAGRRTPGADARVPDPALDAGARFAALLARSGVRVTGAVTRRPAPAEPVRLATVSSPPLSSLVEEMLVRSDNDLAEALLRHVAVARGEPATFEGGAAATLAVLAELGVPAAGAVLLDGSGLARGSRVTPATLATVLRAAAAPDRPALGAVLTGLPVAGLTGTLAQRYVDGRSSPAAGRVRAKTGTLTGVSALAGTVRAGGRVLAFVVLADRVPAGGTAAARDRLDRVATALAACGCR